MQRKSRPQAEGAASRQPKEKKPQRPPSAKQLERQRRQALAKRRLLARSAAVLATVAALWGLWAAISGSQLFLVKTVDVDGNARLSADHVRSLAAIPDGLTLLRLDAEEVARRVSRDPWVSEVDVARRLPDTVVIRIRERVPVVLVDTGLTFWFVDGDARVLSESTPGTETASALPMIRDLPDFTAEAGVISRSETLDNTLRILRGMNGDIISMVRSISAPSVTETALVTSSGVEIMVGEATRLEEKSVLVRDILAEQGEGVVFIDVRSVERPISRGIR